MNGREKVIAEAHSFLGTRYHHMGRIKIRRDADGAITEPGGVDCAQFPFLVYRNAGAIPDKPMEYYPPDWFAHRDGERYLAEVLEHADEVEEPGPADLVLWKIGRAFAHGAIVTLWPTIIHASMEDGMVLLADGTGGRTADKPRRFFSLKDWSSWV